MGSTGPAAVELHQLTRRFGNVVALDGVSLSIERGEFFALLGPSGCGKTTLLRVVAGLELPDEGSVRIEGQDTAGLPAHRRPVNTVFQSYALFPHLTVWNNIAFGLRMKKTASAEMKRRVDQAMELVQVQGLGERKPSQLSGGQKQRVALARAIVNEPKVLLLDEPLGALDLKLRKELQVELRGLQRRLRMTFLYVTHDQEEALLLSDRMAVMRDGRIEQLGDAQTLYEQPRTRFASQFLGSCSLLKGTVKSRTAAGASIETACGELRVARTPPAAQNVTLAIRPEKVQIEPALGNPGENRVRVRIAQLLYAGAETHYELRAGAESLRAEVMNAQPGAPRFSLGEDVFAYLPAESLIILDD